jgi:hypothetical protein
VSRGDASPEVAAVETVGGVLTDLVGLAERLPVPPGQAEETARILDRLSQEISEAAAMLRGGVLRRLDGSIPVDDPRVTAARVLLAEHHQPLTMTPGDVRYLLARFQRRTVELLEVIDGGRR